MQGVFDPEGGSWVQVGEEGISLILNGIIKEGSG